jgi:hypothetical protein
MPSPKIPKRAIFFPVETCNFQIIAKGSAKTAPSMSKSRTPTAINDVVWLPHFPPSIVRSQLNAIGRHIIKAVRTAPKDQAAIKPITIQEAIRNLRMKNIRL